jgi:hypothetical protein
MFAFLACKLALIFHKKTATYIALLAVYENPLNAYISTLAVYGELANLFGRCDRRLAFGFGYCYLVPHRVPDGNTRR